MKQAITNIETGPPEYETRQHWADRFDGNQKSTTRRK